MDFLTTEYVKQEAEKGTLPALKCSLKHHEQGRDAKRWELMNAIEATKFGVRGDFCACCERNAPGVICGKDTVCPLKEKKESCCGGKWNTLCETLDYLEEDYSNANFQAFQEAEADLCTYIEGKIAEEEAKAKKPEETYSIGDRFEEAGRKFFIAGIGKSKVAMVDMKTGNHFGYIKTVRASCGITKSEMDDVCSMGRLTRYWDNQKKVYTDGRDDKKECKCKPDLKALDKLELREGDYGRRVNVDFVIIDITDRKITMRWSGMSDKKTWTTVWDASDVTKSNLFTILGNIFDDIAAIGEGQEDFRTDGVRCKLDGSVMRMGIPGSGWSMSLPVDQLHDFAIGLLGLEAKLKTK